MLVRDGWLEGMDKSPSDVMRAIEYDDGGGPAHDTLKPSNTAK